jgi:cytochrome b561
MASTDKYTRGAVLLHWLIAVLVLANVILGIGHDYFQKSISDAMVYIHESIGIAVLGLALMRLIWRLTHTPPPLPAAYPQWEKNAAQLAHYALYCLIFIMPISGWLKISASNSSDQPWTLFWLIPWFHIGFISNLDPATKKTAHHIFSLLHTYFAYALYGVLGLHVLAALKHQFIDKQPELQRMWR